MAEDCFENLGYKPEKKTPGMMLMILAETKQPFYQPPPPHQDLLVKKCRQNNTRRPGCQKSLMSRCLSVGRH